MAWHLPNKKVLFLHISKAGGTSITRWLRDNFDARKFGPKHCRIQRAKDKGLDLNFHFTIVRNPFARVHSWYYYHVGLYDKQGATRLLTKWEEPSQKGFNWWIKNCDKTPNTKRSIWWTQKSFIDTNLPYITCKLENIQSEFVEIQKYLNCYEPLPITNTSKHSHYRNDYDDESKKIIEDFFREDLEYFDYEF